MAIKNNIDEMKGLYILINLYDGHIQVFPKTDKGSGVKTGQGKAIPSKQGQKGQGKAKNGKKRVYKKDREDRKAEYRGKQDTKQRIFKARASAMRSRNTKSLLASTPWIYAQTRKGVVQVTPRTSTQRKPNPKRVQSMSRLPRRSPKRQRGIIHEKKRT